jgi:hypothetical protein
MGKRSPAQQTDRMSPPVHLHKHILGLGYLYPYHLLRGFS